MKAKATTRHGWSLWHAALALVLAGLAALVSSDAWTDIWRIANRDEESSHILLVLPAMLWILFVRRESLRNCRPVGQWVGSVAMALGWLLWSVGYDRDIEAFWHGGAVIMVVGGLLTVLGADVLVRFWPAFFVLVFLVPVPGVLRQALAMPMQTATAIATQWTAELLGMDVERWGNVLMHDGQQVAVAEACNGMRLVFTLFLVSYTFAYITPLREYVRFLIIAASPLTAIVCNVIRLVPTVWVYGWADTQNAELFHDISGWVMLGVGFALLMGIIKLLRWLMLPIAPYRLVAG